MQTKSFVFAALCTRLCISSCHPISDSQQYGQPPTVYLHDDRNVTLIGTSANEVESFLNIRFGSDTSGENRFAQPTPYTYAPNTIVNASQPGAACPQKRVPLEDLPIFSNVTNMSEDCLNLRIDRPAGMSSAADLPVMVYIYGGGHTIGQIYDSAYDPTMLVSGASQNGLPVIYVAMNYRVGVFGFAASPALEQENSLNAGLFDQRLALEWIQKHIAAFGGDPDNVTIFGESAGATGVGLQITAFGGQDGNAPFSKAIMQSGGPTASQGTVSNYSATNTQALIDLVNCTNTNSVEELSCLRNLPLPTLLESAIQYELSISSFAGFHVFIPTSPSMFIPESPSTLLSSGKFSYGIDIITGWNEDDGSVFVPPTLESDSDVAAWLSSTIPGISNATIQDILALYPASSFTGPGNTAQFFQASRISRDLSYTCPSLLMTHANRKYSNAATSNYLYALNQTVFTPLLAAYNMSFLGVTHFSDLPYVVNQAATRYADVASPEDVELATQVSGSWASFATSGDPSRGNRTLAAWSDAFAADTTASSGVYNVRVIGGPRGGLQQLGDAKGTYDQDLIKRCEFWNSAEMLALLGV